MFCIETLHALVTCQVGLSYPCAETSRRNEIMIHRCAQVNTTFVHAACCCWVVCMVCCALWVRTSAAQLQYKAICLSEDCLCCNQ